MTNDSGALSIDFIAGFTIFLIAFVWVISLLPGLLIGLQAYNVDYDAVAYRTGVILVEDPGATTAMNITTPWESLPPDQVARFGLAISRDTPNILSEEKIDLFFDTTTFAATDFREKAIFGDYPYHFNISLRDVDRNVDHPVGDVLPEGYGYIRRLVKIKGPSNATINENTILIKNNPKYVNDDKFNTTNHTFLILINTSKLYTEEPDLSYQINPVQDQIMINITGLDSISIKSNPNAKANLTSIKINDQPPPPGANVSIDGGSYVSVSTLPAVVTDDISISLSPAVFQNMFENYFDPALYPPVLVNLKFDMHDSAGKLVNSTFLNNTWSPASRLFDYNYDPHNVTQPHLRDAVVEVAVW